MDITHLATGQKVKGVGRATHKLKEKLMVELNQLIADKRG